MANAVQAQAVVSIWRGGDSSWHNSGNWSNGIPTATGIAQFSNKTNNRDPLFWDDAEVGQIIWGGNDDAETMSSGSGTSPVLTLNGVTYGTTKVGLDLQIARLPSFSPSILLGDTQTWKISATSGTPRITFNGGVALNGKDLTLSSQIAGASFLFNGVVSGTGSLTQAGPGTTILAANNTYVGSTTISGGTLQVGNGGTTGTLGTGNVVNNATLRLNRSTEMTIAGAISGTGAVIQAGTGTTILTGTNTYTGTTTVSSGTLQIGNGGTTGSLGTGNVVNNATLRLNRTDTLTVNNAISGIGSLVQAGTGTTILGGANTYTGSTTISAGTLQLGGSSRISDSSALVFNGGTLALNGFSEKVGSLSIQGNSVLDFGTTAGANTLIFSTITTAPGTLSIMNYTAGTDFIGATTAAISTTLLDSLYFVGIGSGAVQSNVQTNTTLGLAYAFTPKAITWTSWSSNLSQSWNTAGNWSNGIPGFNGYASFGTGTQTNVNLNAAATLNGLRFASGAASYTITGANTLTLSGASATSTAFIQQFSINNQTLSPTALALARDTVVDISGAGNLTIGAAISGTGSLTRESAGGKLILTGANTFSGNVYVNKGVVQITGGSGLGSAVGSTTIASGAALELNGTAISSAEAISLAGTGIGNTGAIRSIAGNNTLSGALTLTADSRINADAGTLTLSGTISGANSDLTFGGAGNIQSTQSIAARSLTKDGTGTVTLSGANSFTGNTTVSAGTLVANNASALGTTNYISVSSGAALGLAANITVPAGTLDLAGNGVGNSGALYNVSGTNVVNGSVNVFGTTGIAARAGTLTLNGDLALRSSGTHTLSFDTAAGSTISVGGDITNPLGILNLTHTGSGTFKLLGSGNAYQGNTTVGTAGGTSTGTFIVGMNALPTMNQSSKFTVHSGTLALEAGATARIFGDLVLGGGGLGSTANVTTGTGTLILDHHVTYSGSTNNANGATISGNVNLRNGSHIFTVTNSTAAANDLTVDANMGETGGMAGLAKYGAGTLVLSGNNSFSGLTEVQQGTVNVRHDTALGTTTTGTSVSYGATLQLEGGRNIVGEELIMAGFGQGNTGALHSKSGDNTWTSFIVLSGSDVRIQTDLNSTLTLSGANDSSIASDWDTNLIIGGAGTTNISSAISLGVGALTKQDSGTLVLSGANSFQGPVSIEAGIVRAESNSALGSNNTTVVNSGATLQVAGDVALTGSLVLGGNGVSSTSGALHNVSGMNIFAGDVTLASATKINTNAGTMLTVVGNLNGANTLTKAGTGTLRLLGSTGTIGDVALNEGTILLTETSHMQTGAIASASPTSLVIASGGSIDANYSAGTTFFSGSMSGGSGSTFTKSGNGTMVLNKAGGFDAGSLTLELSGGTLKLLNTSPTGTSEFKFGTIKITGDTILDFGDSAGTFLTAGKLEIASGVKVQVLGWKSVAGDTANSTVWWVLNQVGTSGPNGTNQTPGDNGTLGQITFVDPEGNFGDITTWVDYPIDGWFDHEIRPTPEPEAYGAIFISGCLALVSFRRWRSRKNAA